MHTPLDISGLAALHTGQILHEQGVGGEPKPHRASNGDLVTDRTVCSHRGRGTRSAEPGHTHPPLLSIQRTHIHS